MAKKGGRRSTKKKGSRKGGKKSTRRSPLASLAKHLASLEATVIKRCACKKKGTKEEIAAAKAQKSALQEVKKAARELAAKNEAREAKLNAYYS